MASSQCSHCSSPQMLQQVEFGAQQLVALQGTSTMRKAAFLSLALVFVAYARAALLFHMQRQRPAIAAYVCNRCKGDGVWGPHWMWDGHVAMNVTHTCCLQYTFTHTLCTHTTFTHTFCTHTTYTHTYCTHHHIHIALTSRTQARPVLLLHCYAVLGGAPAVLLLLDELDGVLPTTPNADTMFKVCVVCVFVYVYVCVCVLHHPHSPTPHLPPPPLPLPTPSHPPQTPPLRWSLWCA